MISATSTSIRLFTLVKAAALGAVLSEAWYLGTNFQPQATVLLSIHSCTPFITVAGLSLLVSFLYVERTHISLVRVLRSGRFDVLFAFCFGCAISVLLGGIGTSVYRAWSLSLTANQFGVICLIPIGLLISLFLGQLTSALGRPRPSVSSFFLDDKPIDHASQDLLNVADSARRFADLVLNHNSQRSVVFGIDAPWGIGKSTFINLCKERWLTLRAANVVIYDFNPIKYEDSKNLTSVFVDGLIRAIRNHSYIPDLSVQLSRYSRLLQGARARLPIIDVEILANTDTADEALASLDAALSLLGAKVIIIVDDLDRLTLAAAKQILYTIKKSFSLPNVSYVLAYDTENIGALEAEAPDADKLTEFLEKFINIKVGLYIESSNLIRYVSDNLAAALSGNSQADPQLVSRAIAGLVDILKSKDYHKYHLYIGDVRKIKRLINTILLLAIDRTDFENTDFNREDLIHLLLIYINYPAIFRDIYDSETEGRYGLFSVVSPDDTAHPDFRKAAQSGAAQFPYKNSLAYRRYRKKLRPVQRFLIDRVFNEAVRLNNEKIGQVSEEARTSFACFNGSGGGGRNLEQYLHLIVRLTAPQSDTQYHFYLNKKNEIVEGRSIAEVLSDPEFAWTKRESARDQLWRVVVNSTRDITHTLGTLLIGQIMRTITDYCLLEDATVGIGLRQHLPFYLVKLLDACGWSGPEGDRGPNTPENISEIADWILCEGRHKTDGVIITLSGSDRGILGFYDLLVFRLYCSADRGGDTFNLQRALILRGNPSARTDGLTKDLALNEMREISQRIFSQFKAIYIVNGINIFDVIDELSESELCGKYLPYVQERRANGELEAFDTLIAALKSQLMTFITYQLGASRAEFGVPCGYYDVTGSADGKGISAAINAYLFDVCFNSQIAKRNYEHFLDYLLMNFSSTFGGGPRRYIPSADEFTKTIHRHLIADYWERNRAEILMERYTNRDRVVWTRNYRVTYRDHLEGVFEVLDSLVDEQGAIEPVTPNAAPD